MWGQMSYMSLYIVCNASGLNAVRKQQSHHLVKGRRLQTACCKAIGVGVAPVGAVQAGPTS